MAAADATVLTFRVAEQCFALDAARIAEVAARPPVTRVPGAPSSLAGLASLRGRVLPVIDLGRLLVADAVAGAGSRLIVLDGAEPIALAVDEVTGLAAGGGERGLVATEDGVARVVPLEELLESAFANAFRRGRAHRAGGPAAPTAAAPVESAATVALIGFCLAGQPYALPLEHVREVIAPPAEIAALPRTDAAMLGVAEVRGALIPIVSTRALLGLPPAPLGPAARVIVVAVGDAQVGLAVDQVSAILRAPESAVGPTPRLLNRGAGEAKVVSILRLEGGGLVSVLDPARLFAEESLALILEDGRGASEAASAGGAAETSQRFLVFQLGAESYGLDIAAVEEVAQLPERLTRLPRAPAYVLGVMNLRGAAVPVIDQRRRFEIPDGGAPARPRVIVTRVGELVAGFAVDAVSQILELPASRLAPTPELAQDAGRIFDRVAQVEADGRVILLVNPRELLDRAETDLLASLAAAAADA